MQKYVNLPQGKHLGLGAADTVIFTLAVRSLGSFVSGRTIIPPRFFV